MLHIGISFECFCVQGTIAVMGSEGRYVIKKDLFLSLNVRWQSLYGDDNDLEARGELDEAEKIADAGIG